MKKCLYSVHCLPSEHHFLANKSGSSFVSCAILLTSSICAGQAIESAQFLRSSYCPYLQILLQPSKYLDREECSWRKFLGFRFALPKGHSLNIGPGTLVSKFGERSRAVRLDIPVEQTHTQHPCSAWICILSHWQNIFLHETRADLPIRCSLLWHRSKTSGVTTTC